MITSQPTHPPKTKKKTLMNLNRVKLSIRPSKTVQGFGLYASQDLSKGQFVCLYAGEVISSQEALQRWKTQSNHSQANYILVIRESNPQQTWKTIIDPTHRGNIGLSLSTFLNLSSQTFNHQNKTTSLHKPKKNLILIPFPFPAIKK